MRSRSISSKPTSDGPLHRVPNEQEHSDPNEPHGTVVLPLWQETTEFNKTSPHWQAFNTFLDELAIVLRPASNTTASQRRGQFNHAIQIYQQQANFGWPIASRRPAGLPI
ncbi:uncharacterized protein PAC_01124 [Phialocephala subalpina]|uniref:Uncharacterized protein n=1 Tax=Phialocephala subalpina TaxID=576137 RepID=A0A1L7WEV6_9HELO|nr:uncharacterized protein PAC_01124 [Phialocephala subalpina]